MSGQPFTEVSTPPWADETELHGPGGVHVRGIPFGPVLWDGSRRKVEIRQYYGPDVLTRGRDKFNPWRDGTALVSGLLGNLDAEGCRAAATALLEAAALLDGVEGSRP